MERYDVSIVAGRWRPASVGGCWETLTIKSGEDGAGLRWDEVQVWIAERRAELGRSDNPWSIVEVKLRSV